MGKCKVAVIIITYNAMAWKEKCLLNLRHIPSNAFVYCIDNGSTDGTQEFIRKECPNFNFYQSKVNLGFGKANNLGFEIALNDGCTHFLLLNQDAEISWVNIFELVRIQLKNPDFGIISPLQMYNNQNVDFLHLKSLTKNGVEYFNDLICNNQIRDIYEIQYTNAAIWLLSKECLRKVGGFDPIFPHYGEDNDYANRVTFFGLKFGLAPLIDAFHYRNQFNLSVSKNRNAYYISFLVRLKSMNHNTNKTYFKLLLELISGAMNSKSEFGGVSSWKALFMVIKDYFTIKKHKRINLSNDFSFLTVD